VVSFQDPEYEIRKADESRIFFIYMVNLDLTLQVGEAANPGTKALVAQNTPEEEKRLQAFGAGASRGGQLDQ
jgi:hypothetical protein